MQLHFHKQILKRKLVKHVPTTNVVESWHEVKALKTIRTSVSATVWRSTTTQRHQAV